MHIAQTDNVADRRRFSIESSYRIAEIARARISRRETAVRLLNMFMAVLIEN
jgi:hypothetical protein